jgi:phosphatidylglycerophosphate synthase
MSTATQNNELDLFNKTGFFEEKELALKHLRDADEILFSKGVDYCVMFGTLLGLLRHDGFIPWDDDLDIIIFDIEKFESRCRHRFEDRGYVVYDDMRIIEGVEKHCGYRIHAEQGLAIAGQTWKFPWLGVWEPDIRENTMTLPPEEFSYSVEDFFPLQRKRFLDFTVSVPRFSEKIVKQYYGSDCMEMCMLHNLDHRKYKPTGFPKTKFPLADVLAFLKDQTTEGDTLKQDASYPNLAKKASDGKYCYIVQRRISLYISLFCVRKGISANAATGIDMLFAILAAWSLSQGYYLAGVILIQVFGLWSCVDGEIARLTKKPSQLGDFYDTMVDRLAEVLIFAGVLYSIPSGGINYPWGTLFFCYIGMVLLITASSEKFRSVYHKNYPKSACEGLFSWLCAGSDTRFLYLSAAILVYTFTGYAMVIKWLIIAMSFLLGINFAFRMWKISTLPIEDNKSSN